MQRQADRIAMGPDSRKGAESPPAMFVVDSVYALLIRLLPAALIVVLCLWMLAGIGHMLLGFGRLAGDGWTRLAEHVIVDALIVLALLEVVRTLQAYMKLGRVRVTFILDTALVVLIGELMGLWFKDYQPQKVLLGIGVIVVLVVLRIVTARFSPAFGDTA
ncbi:MAG TPA: phosphate-starvation-inducible PsiE family protein [Acidiferrobacterales bacterium]